MLNDQTGENAIVVYRGARGTLSVDVETSGARNENPLWTLVIIATGASCKQCDGDGQVLRGDLHGYDHTSHHSTRSSTARRRLVRTRTLVLSRANTPGAEAATRFESLSTTLPVCQLASISVG
jgi:hypothetical protein